MKNLPFQAQKSRRIRRLLLVLALLTVFQVVQTSSSDAATMPTAYAFEQATSEELPYVLEKSSSENGGIDPHYSLPESPIRAAGTISLSNVVSDDFNRSNMDTSRWTFVNLLNDGQINMVGSGTSNAYLELSVPAGTSHDPWHSNRSVRAMQAVGDGDFEIEIKYDSVPSLKYQMQGVIVEQDADNWLRLELQHDGTSLRLLAIATVNGSSSVKNAATVTLGSVAYMRVARNGDNWTLSYSADGNTWDDSVAFIQSMTVSAVGPYAANHGAGNESPPSYTASVDYFENRNLPIVNEDTAAGTDSWPPLLHSVRRETTTTTLTVMWNTDEPANGMLEFGPTMGYGSTVSETVSSYIHSLTAKNLTAGATYHYRVVSSDVGGHTDTTQDIMVTLSPDDSEIGPAISIWYGDRQSFGHLGLAQTWINILGDAQDPDGIKSLSYQLNGGTVTMLRMGPDNRRLQSAGDFNVDIATSRLLSGDNALRIIATDNLDNESTKNVTVAYTPGRTWPSPYAVDWSTLADIDDLPDVAQVIDGKWKLENGAIRIGEPGYDRLIGLGDVQWQDYEITVPVTMHSYLSGERGIGFLLRWIGHTDVPRVCDQPKCGWQPLGALAWYHGTRLELFSYDPDECESTSCTSILDQSGTISLTLGKKYWFKAQVQTSGDTGHYKFKVWDASVPEPSGWDVSGQALPQALSSGSVLLLSHRYDATFGATTITPLGSVSNNPPVAVDDNANVRTSGEIAIDVADNDSDSDGTLDMTSVWIVTDPQYGTANPDPVTGIVTYEHDGGGSEEDSFTYIIRDNSGAGSNVANVNIDVDITLGNDPPLITLIGVTPLMHEAGIEYLDSGATALDDIDGDISNKIVVAGDKVNENVTGVYTIHYDVTDSDGNDAQQISRIVHVVDTTAPVITIGGANPLTLEANGPFNDPGATAIDSFEGDLTDAIRIGGDLVNVSVLGTYLVTYDVEDGAGNKAVQSERVVQVVDTTPPTLSLRGANPMTIAVGSPFVDPGAVAWDSVDGEITDRISVDVIGGGPIDTNQSGSYIVTYDVSDLHGNASEQVKRIVHVLVPEPEAEIRLHIPMIRR